MWRLVLRPLAVMAALTLGVIGVGRWLLPTSPALAAFPDCDTPCWLGIVPGETTLFNAMDTLEAAGYTDPDNASLFQVMIYQAPPPNPCRVYMNHIGIMSETAVVEGLTLRGCTDSLRLGDLYLRFQPADGLSLVNKSVFFDQQRVEAAWRGRPRCLNTISPLHPVDLLTLTSTRIEPLSIAPWQGFITYDNPYRRC